ncbi:dihydrofolate reductase family protein [Lewinella sp. 4G2]|uniref:dihydrofolate reductase family protein n=1 Tax=Lewinella sp. 4G2 TaxID=1803372 RepID=UPI0007B48DDA|nr:dihydrofolate reductase family protein [Lewinella sp. 4G2]OAV45165.1 diacylglycerol kinase [Lewinella sp. 4G2]
MPKTKIFTATSLDGYLAGPNGELDWLETTPNPTQNDMGFVALMNEIDAVVMGRTTFETVLAFGVEWPYAKPVFVLSNTLKKVPAELRDKVSLTRGTPMKVVDQLHQAGYETLYVDGGATIQSFLRDDLVDELCITTIPILLGGGASLFGELTDRLTFDLVKVEVFLEHVVQTTYRRTR